MFMREGDIVTEPYIPVHGEIAANTDGKYVITVMAHNCYDDIHDGAENPGYIVGQIDDIKFDSVLVDFYVARTAAAQ